MPKQETDIDRLIIEEAQLDKRMTKLAKLIRNDEAFYKKTQEQQFLLKKQFVAMSDYLAILNKRLELLKQNPPE